MKLAVTLNDFVPAARNRKIKQTDSGQCAADHDRRLNDVRPDDRLNSAERCVDRSQKHNRDDCADVDEKCFSLIRPDATNHFVAEREGNRCDVQARARREQSCEKENG